MTHSSDQSKFSSETTRALLRDKLVGRVMELSEIELRYLLQESGLAETDAPQVHKFPGNRYKLSTDPVEMPPYVPAETEEDWYEEILATSDAAKDGKRLQASASMEELRARLK